jgi:hypothetical protein
MHAAVLTEADVAVGAVVSFWSGARTSISRGPHRACSALSGADPT